MSNFVYVIFYYNYEYYIYFRSFIGSSELSVIMSSEAKFKFKDNDRGMIELK